MALINKKLTDLTEKLSVPDDAFIHIVDTSDTSQSPQGSSYKAKKSTISGTVKAQSTVSGTVKTNSNSADPVVYLKSETDALIVGKQDSLGFTPENITNKQNNLSADVTNVKYPTVTAVNLGLSDKANTADLLLKADKTSTYTKAEVDNLDAQVLIDANVYTDSKVTSLYKIMPSVANFASLPLIDNEVGDVRNVIDTGMNYVWDGVLWDALGSTVDISGKEDVANKQNSLAVDATNLKYPTVTAVNTGLALKANIASPTFTGTPTAPTATAGTNTTQIATTAFVSAADAGNVKLTGEQTIAGNKIFVNTGTTPSVINSVSGSSAADAGITGRASAAGTIGIRATAIVGAQAALKITSNQAGSAGSITPLLLIENVLSGNDMTPIKIVTYGTEVARVSHLGAYTGTSFIKSGGTSSQALLADGNVLTNPISGTGTTNYISKFTGSGTVGNSQIFDNGSNVGIGVTPSSTPNNFSLESINGNSIQSRTALSQFAISNNISGDWFSPLYKTTGFSSRIVLDGANTGGILFSTAISGTSGTSITSSEVMRLSAIGNVGINQPNPTEKLDVVGNGKFSGTVRTGGYTVATLPAGTIGMCTYVTDALAPTYNGILVGGGSVVVKAFYNGTNWVNQ